MGNLTQEEKQMDHARRPVKVRDYAAWAGVTPWTVYQWIKQGKVKALKIGRDWRIDPSELEAFTQRTSRPDATIDAINEALERSESD
jgi:excisionase family DNA binding protein